MRGLLSSLPGVLLLPVLPTVVCRAVGALCPGMGVRTVLVLRDNVCVEGKPPFNHNDDAMGGNGLEAMSMHGIYRMT